MFLFDDVRQPLSVFATIASIFVHLLDALPDQPEAYQGNLRQKQNAAFYILAHEIQNSHTGSA
jgi:hypothetical protein